MLSAAPITNGDISSSDAGEVWIRDYACLTWIWFSYASKVDCALQWLVEYCDNLKLTQPLLLVSRPTCLPRLWALALSHEALYDTTKRMGVTDAPRERDTASPFHKPFPLARCTSFNEFPWTSGKKSVLPHPLRQSMRMGPLIRKLRTTT